MALVALAICAGGCQRHPGGGADETGTQSPYAGPAPAALPAEALDYLAQCLRSPATAEHPPLARTWLAIARLRVPPDHPQLAALKEQVLEQAEQAGETGPVELAAAWLYFAPKPAERFISTQVPGGGTQYLESLRYSPEAGRRVLNGLDIAALAKAEAYRVVSLLQSWGDIGAEDEALLRALGKRGEMDIALWATGQLARLHPADEALSESLFSAVRDAVPEGFSAAAEGARVSGLAGLADAFVPFCAKAQLGEPPEGQAAAPDRQLEFSAYALAYLPGDQAALMRRKLLSASQAAVRWQACLGKLLHGDPQPWDAAVAKAGIDDKDLWVTLQPPQALHAALLPTYLAAAKSERLFTRGLAATELNRYAQMKSDPMLGEALALLVHDAEAEVRATAWYTLGGLGLKISGSDPLEAVRNSGEDPAVRLAAAYAALAAAGGGEMR
jgi:hypothetical protein